MTALYGLLAGLAYGVIAQRGFFCLNSGFRHLLVRRDSVKFKAFLLAVSLQMLALPLLVHLGWARVTVPAFYPLGAVAGGYLFGVAMAWAGGCAAGVWYKWGEGRWDAFVALLGLALGAAATQAGPLRGVREAVQAVASGESVRSATVGDLVGGAWAAPAVGVALLLWLARRPGGAPPGSWSWRRTGLLMGAASALAWPLSALADRAFGMAVIPGSVRWVEWTTAGQGVRLDWDAAFVAAIPLGAWLSARLRGPLAAEPVASGDLARSFAGGALLGVGASLAGGCTVGHSLVGLPLLSLGSLVTTLFIVLGSWTTGYFELRRRRAG